ncbi:Disulfide bond formation protein B [compost metagenome]
MKRGALWPLSFQAGLCSNSAIIFLCEINQMIEFLRRIASHRLAWGLLAVSALAFELCALFFQHVLGLHPCVMCIYERIAILGVFAAGLLGMVAPEKWYLRWSAMLLWGYSAFWGLKLALKHVDYQVNPSPFNVCEGFVDFPSWAPLDQWVPWLFFPDGDCSEISWQFLSFSMPQWLVLIFAAYLLVFVVVTIGNLVKGRCCN